MSPFWSDACGWLATPSTCFALARPQRCQAEALSISSDWKLRGLQRALFGTEVRPENVISETLTRATFQPEFERPETIESLREVIHENAPIPTEYQAFIGSLMASWLEDRLGLRREAGDGRLVRGRPRPIVGERSVARELSRLTGAVERECERVIRNWLLAGYACGEHPESHTRPFAFRLHQFISPGDSVYASLEERGERHLSLSGQQFVPGSNKTRVLLPLAFCRECGAEYHIVWKHTDSESGRIRFKPREISDRLSNDEDVGGRQRR